MSVRTVPVLQQQSVSIQSVPTSVSVLLEPLLIHLESVDPLTSVSLTQTVLAQLCATTESVRTHAKFLGPVELMQSAHRPTTAQCAHARHVLMAIHWFVVCLYNVSPTLIVPPRERA